MYHKGELANEFEREEQRFQKDYRDDRFAWEQLVHGLTRLADTFLSIRIG